MPRPGDRKEDEKGFLEWKQPEGCTEGWWSRVEDEEIVALRTPHACPCCGDILDNWSVSYYNRHGVCADCYFDYLHGRSNLPKFKSIVESTKYCKQKRHEKQGQK